MCSTRTTSTRTDLSLSLDDRTVPAVVLEPAPPGRWGMGVTADSQHLWIFGTEDQLRTICDAILAKLDARGGRRDEKSDDTCYEMVPTKVECPNCSTLMHTAGPDVLRCLQCGNCEGSELILKARGGQRDEDEEPPKYTRPGIPLTTEQRADMIRRQIGQDDADFDARFDQAKGTGPAKCLSPGAPLEDYGADDRDITGSSVDVDDLFDGMASSCSDGIGSEDVPLSVGERNAPEQVP